MPWRGCGDLPGRGGFRGAFDDHAENQDFQHPASASETKTSYAPLAKGPALQLGRAGAGEDEDCVRVTRMVGPDGRVYVTRGLICQD